MTIEDRIAALEREIEMLKARDSRRESEHRRLLTTRAEIAEEVRGAAAEDYALVTAANDEQQARVKGTISQIAAAVSIGNDNEKVLIEAQQLLARQLDEQAQAINTLTERLVAAEDAVITSCQIEKDFRSMHAQIAELYERFRAGSSRPKKNPSDN